MLRETTNSYTILKVIVCVFALQLYVSVCIKFQPSTDAFDVAEYSAVRNASFGVTQPSNTDMDVFVSVHKVD